MLLYTEIGCGCISAIC